MDTVRLLAMVIAMRILSYFAKSWLARRRQNKQEPEPAKIDPKELASLHSRWEKAVKGLGATGKHYTVIGTGFLGTRVVAALVLRGEEHVTAFDLVISDALRQQFPSVKFVQGNVTDMEAVRAVVRGADVVYSTFACIRYHEALPFQLRRSAEVNVDGTNTLVEACIASNVKMLVSTSTSNVCVTKGIETKTFDETTPYVNLSNAPHHYAFTKAQAELLVLQANNKPTANGQGQLLTGAVRPCSGIFGARDRFIMQRLLEKQRYDYITVSKINWVYVDNVVWAHLLMERALATNPTEAGGKPVCVSNNYEGSILELFDMAKKLRPDLSYSALNFTVIMGLARILDFLRGILKDSFPALGELDMLSVCAIEAAGSNYLLDKNLNRAKKLLGYDPVFTVEEGVMLSVAELDKRTPPAPLAPRS